MRLPDELIFIHIPRCGGTSINQSIKLSGRYKELKLDYRCEDLVHLYGETYFNNYPIELDHCTIEHMKIFVSDHEMHNSFKFAIIRDPVDRAVSIYRRATKERDFRYLSDRDIRDFSSFVTGLEHLRDMGFFHMDNLLDIPMRDISHFIPQSLYVCDREGKVFVDKMVMIEDLNEAVDEIFNNLNINCTIDPTRYNSSTNALPGIEERDIKRIMRIYKEDYKLLCSDKLFKPRQS